MQAIPKRIFVTGTDTGIGKTLVSAALTWGLKGHYFKPFQSGAVEDRDRDWVQQITGLGETHFSPESYLLQAALSPNQAAELEQVTIEPSHVALPHYQQTHLITEGVGGLMVPLNPQTLLLDWLKPLDMPVLLVARSGLGTLNHTLLSIEALRHRAVPIWGIVLNGPLNPANARDIEHFTQLPILAQIEPFEQLNTQTLDHIFSQFLPL